MRLLLARDDVNPAKLDNGGKTPLSAASEPGHEVVVRLPLALGDFNLNQTENYGETPLCVAPRNGRERGGEAIILPRRHKSRQKKQ